MSSITDHKVLDLKQTMFKEHMQTSHPATTLFQEMAQTPPHHPKGCCITAEYYMILYYM